MAQFGTLAFLKEVFWHHSDLASRFLATIRSRYWTVPRDEFTSNMCRYKRKCESYELFCKSIVFEELKPILPRNNFKSFRLGKQYRTLSIVITVTNHTIDRMLLFCLSYSGNGSITCLTFEKTRRVEVSP